MAGSDLDPDGVRLPIKIDSTTNGEVSPRPISPRQEAGNAYAMQKAVDQATRLGLGRRAFLTSLCGAAATLTGFNVVNRAYGQVGGTFEIPEEAASEPALAHSVLGKKHFVFDVQTHHFDPVGTWRDPSSPWLTGALRTRGIVASSLADPAVAQQMDLLAGPNFVKEIFLDSDTDFAVLTFVPTTEEGMVLTMQEASRTRDAVAALKATKRLVLHGRFAPTYERDVNSVAEQVDRWGIVAAKTYTQFQDVEHSFWLDDHRTMDPFVDELQKSKINIMCIHKGLPFPIQLAHPDTTPFHSCKDVGPAARNYPDMNFVIYHSGYVQTHVEGPYSERGAAVGVNSLIRSLRRAGVRPGRNVYAEMGGTWRFLMNDPDQAAHMVGKLLKYLGEDNVVWGTDCIFYGSPQDQIQAFQSFQISEEFREKFGYPKITDEIRAKIFGLNSARLYKINATDVAALRSDTASDPLRTAREIYRERPDPSFITYGPKTRSEFLRLARLGHH